jgi:RimJ/RimL family protein N-acetyltransferase
VHLALNGCDVRSWRRSDIDALAQHANNRNIWINLRDQFPYPYTKRHARAFIQWSRDQNPETAFAIARDEEAIGGIGFALRTDVERVSAEIGYWLAESHWGQGIATEALIAVTAYATETHGLTRIFAVPFATNHASCRVLEKAGYVLEGRLRRSAIKNNEIVDQVLYAFIA